MIKRFDLIHKTVFQYHKGAIISNFRPTRWHIVARISIPQRCDYFFYGPNRIFTPIVFQYHKGAIISVKIDPSPPAITTISIPQRCDYFFLFGFAYHNFRLISIPQRCDYFYANGYKDGLLCEISIPQRCDYFPDKIAINHQSRRDFNTTKVRLFLFKPDDYSLTFYDFNTTKVRLFPGCICLLTLLSFAFQYHKGAIISLCRCV